MQFRALAWGLHLIMVVIAACSCVPNAVLAAPPWRSPAIDRFVLMETTGPVYDVLYKFGEDAGAKDGAYGLNVHASPSSWYLEEQRAGGYDIIAGVARQDPGLIRLGLRILRYGLKREASDGSFPGSRSSFHGTAMFLSEAAPGLIMLRASSYRDAFGRELTWQTQRMQRADYHLMRLAGGAGRVDDPAKNHRFFEAALAFGAVGILSGDATLIHWSKPYARAGIAMERTTGIMPEDGGHDSGYQALGMINASRYLYLVTGGALYRALRSALVRGEEWELSRIGPDGTVNQTGDTRTAACKERDLAGHCKTVFYAPIYSTFAHWARISGDLRFASAAFQVWKRSGYGAGSKPPARSPGR